MLWLFVILGLCVFTAALFGFLITLRARSIQSGLHFVALFLTGAAWMMGHQVSTGWTAVLVAGLVEVAAWFKAVTRDTHTSEPIQSMPAESPTPTPAAPPKPLRTVSSIALLRTRWQATGEVFLASLRRSGQREAKLVTKGEPIRVEIGPVAIELRMAGQPVPPAQLDYALAQAFDWPEAATHVKGHAAHIVIASQATDDVSRSDVVRQHLRAQVALAEFAPICAVLWSEAGRLIAPGELQRLMRPGSNITGVCLSFRTFPEADGSVVCDTAGLCAFGLPDVQMRTPGDPGEAAAKLLYRIAEELFGSGVEFVDGEKLPARFESDLHTYSSRAAFPPARRVIELRGGTPDNQPESAIG
ncbi:MAG: hypothetical protein HZA51_14415 [Planctomycetes bacterium]|nr:hypothetical protein [Planctomycetota bacterium]